MLSKTVKKKKIDVKKKSKSYSGNLRPWKRIKLKKKWRFWRSFRFFFLRRKSLSFFSKLKWLFNQKRIIWYFFSGLYGKKIKFFFYKKTSGKIAFGKFFFLITAILELRLNVLSVRMRFTSKLLEANNLIGSGIILVNGYKKQVNFLTSIHDVIKKTTLFSSRKICRRMKKKWRVWKWRRWRKALRNLSIKGTGYINIFWFSKRVLFLNYLELNYKILSGVLLRKPVFGEILLTSKKKILSSTMLKKIYYMY